MWRRALLNSRAWKYVLLSTARPPGLCHRQALSVTEAFAPSLFHLSAIHPSVSISLFSSSQPSAVNVIPAPVSKCAESSKNKMERSGWNLWAQTSQADAFLKGQNIHSASSLHSRVATKLIWWPFETPASCACTL